MAFCPVTRAQPSIEGRMASISPTLARVTGQNAITVDDRDPYWQGFSVTDRA